MMDPKLVLYIGDKAYSSWSLRPWIALKHAKLPFEERVVALRREDSKQNIARISPSGRVPCLHHGDLVLAESLAIAEYAAELAPEAGLWPKDRQARAMARALSAEMHAGFAALRETCPMDLTVHIPGGVAMSAEATADVGRIIQIWNETRARYGAGGDYLFGAFTIADAMFAPVVTRFVTYDIDPPGAAGAYIRTIWADPAMREWIKGAEAESGRPAPQPKLRP